MRQGCTEKLLEECTDFNCTDEGCTDHGLHGPRPGTARRKGWPGLHRRGLHEVPRSAPTSTLAGAAPGDARRKGCTDFNLHGSRFSTDRVCTNHRQELHGLGLRCYMNCQREVVVGTHVAEIPRQRGDAAKAEITQNKNIN